MSDHLSNALIYALIFLIIILALVIVVLPWALRRRDHDDALTARHGADAIAESFNMLGQEMKSLREQLTMKERLANLGELSAGIAHELRNPMAVIMGYARFLLMSLDEDDPKRETVKAIIAEIETMNSIMEELLKFSKSESLNKTPTDISLLIERAAKESIRPDSVTFYGPRGIMVECDETLVRQAVKNLINNALEAGSEARLNIFEAVKSGRKGVYIEVCDNGKGMSEEEMKKIFSPFYSTKEGGLGIGLCLVQKIAIAHGFAAEVSSEEGKGSAFRLFLPY